MWIDISVTLRTGMVHWPGDRPVLIERTRSLARGDDMNLSAISRKCQPYTSSIASTKPGLNMREPDAFNELQ